ncbi:glycine zipper 2TM domain-containing protein [Rhodocyclaceae bacterium SMB388]
MIRGLKSVLVLTAAVGALGLGGCASGLGGDTYSRAEARRVIDVQYGTVEAVRYVQIEGTKTPIGPAAGAAVGGIAGSGMGGGSGRYVTSVLGAVVGGVAGAAVEEGATRRRGVEVTVRMPTGRLIAVVQEDGGEGFRPGERVRVLGDGATTRVTR